MTSKEGKGMAHYHSILEVREDIKAHIGDSEITDENLLKWAASLRVFIMRSDNILKVLGYEIDWLIHQIKQEEIRADCGSNTDLAELKADRYLEIVKLITLKFEKYKIPVEKETEEWILAHIELDDKPPIKHPIPPLQSLTTNLTEEQAKRLLIALKENEFIDKNTAEKNWLAVLGFKEFTQDFYRIVWIKKTIPNKQPNKRSLLFLLDYIGCKEDEIKGQINLLFVVKDAKTEFCDKNDFNDFYSHQPTVRSALRNKNSQFDEELKDIVNNILQLKKL